MIYQVANWADYFEGAKSKTYKNKSSCQMPTKHGLGYRRLIKAENGPALFGAWCAMIQVLSRHAAPRHGYLTDTGRIPGEPLTPDDLELLTDIPAKHFEGMIQICLNQRVAWLVIADGYHKDTTVSAQYPLDSDLDSDSDSDSDRDTRKRETEYPGFVALLASEWPLPGTPPVTTIIGKLKGAGVSDADAVKGLRYYIDNEAERRYYNLAKTAYIHEAIIELSGKADLPPFPTGNKQPKKEDTRGTRSYGLHSTKDR